MIETVILAAEAVSEPTVVTPFEEALLAGLVFVIMFGLGAGLTPRDFRSALRRPWGLIIGWVTQFGFMPLIAYLLVVTLLFPFFPVDEVALIALGWITERPGQCGVGRPDPGAWERPPKKSSRKFVPRGSGERWHCP